ncbi:MAG: MBL fold metallo-hydrolase [Candidatus Rokubacteria bacterium]|nr:MBL fold metallo-hydrolase [Candidatus Rokubacteria bacterium]
MHFAFLGTSGALASLRRDSTSLVFVGAAESVLVDCGGSPLQKLLLAAVDPASLARVVITHIHPDHAYGLPSLLQNLRLLGRGAPLPISCREEHVEPLRTLLALFRLLDRPGAFAVPLEPVPARPRSPVATTPSFAISASPNEHGDMPNLAVRFDPIGGGPAVVYSSDTRPCDQVVALAAGADTLVHDATFLDRTPPGRGVHSTAAEAGEVAARAGVRRLILTHIDPAHHGEMEAMAMAARTRFGGEVEIAEELVPYPL